MSIIPHRITSQSIDPQGRYRCPLCQSQTTGDKHNTGWVQCPMVGNRPICLGCCVDHQAAARADDFERHPYRSLFDVVARLTGAPVPTLRRTCLEHQSEILSIIATVPEDDEAAVAIRRALAGL
jgi:hypothetical protein